MESYENTETVLSKRNVDFKDDLRQAFIVAKYEIMKFLSGKKIFIFGAIVIGTLAILGIVMFVWGNNDIKTEEGVYNFVSFSELLFLIGATLFSSVTLVSEFEERTALMLFTKPIRKGSIFGGKFIAAFVLNVAFMAVYFMVSAILVAIKTGGFTANVFVSMGYCIIYIFALTGIAMLFSALMKKSSSASILTFVFLLLIPDIVSIVIALAADTTDVWYMIGNASLTIPYSINGPVENGLREALVMLVWGIVPLLGSYFLFRKREV